jgi:hypothetical protein
MKRRFWPAIGLFFLAPLVAEYLLGNLPITALFAVIGLAPLYGGGAVLIREFVRRRGWGYPSIVVLALAYGVLEEAVTTQSLFNPNYADLRLLDPGHIGFLGIGAPWTLFVLTLHTVWSITVPIILVEAVSKRPREPWLGNVGFTVTGVLFVLGVAATTLIQLKNDSFVASPAQFTGAGLVFFALIGQSARLGTRPAPKRGPGGVPAVWVVGLCSLVVTSAFMLVDTFDLEGWVTAAVYLVGWVAATLVVLFWSRRESWTRRHVLALASGALLTYAWHAFPESPVFDAPKTVDLIGNGIFAALAVVLLVFAWRRVAMVTATAETTAPVGKGDETIRRDQFSDS